MTGTRQVADENLSVGDPVFINESLTGMTAARTFPGETSIKLGFPFEMTLRINSLKSLMDTWVGLKALEDNSHD